MGNLYNSVLRKLNLEKGRYNGLVWRRPFMTVHQNPLQVNFSNKIHSFSGVCVLIACFYPSLSMGKYTKYCMVQGQILHNQILTHRCRPGFNPQMRWWRRPFVTGHQKLFEVLYLKKKKHTHYLIAQLLFLLQCGLKKVCFLPSLSMGNSTKYGTAQGQPLHSEISTRGCGPRFNPQMHTLWRRELQMEAGVCLFLVVFMKGKCEKKPFFTTSFPWEILENAVLYRANFDIAKNRLRGDDPRPQEPRGCEHSKNTFFGLTCFMLVRDPPPTPLLRTGHL